MKNMMLNEVQAENSNGHKRQAVEHSQQPNKKKVVLHTNTSADNATFLTSDADDNEVELNPSISLADMCDEILYEIFKLVNALSLMSLMNVCQRFQRLALDKGLCEHIDLSQHPLPLGFLADSLERCQESTKCLKLRGPWPVQQVEEEVKHFTEIIKNTFTTRCTKLFTLELFGITLDFNEITFKNFPRTLKRLVLNTCNIRKAHNKIFFNGIEKSLINLEELSIENNSWFNPYYLLPLSNLPLLRYLSLKGCCQINEFADFVTVELPKGFKRLEVIDLRETPLNDADLLNFFAAQKLKEIYLQYPEDEHQNHGQNDQIKNSAPYKISCIRRERPIASNEQPCISSLSTSKYSGKTDDIYKLSVERPTPKSNSVADNKLPRCVVGICGSNRNKKQASRTITDFGASYFTRPKHFINEHFFQDQKRLERITLRGYKRVTDKSLAHFVRYCPDLKFLDISGTNITINGLKCIKFYKPECQVIAEHLIDQG